jgi:hypothetical protein
MAFSISRIIDNPMIECELVMNDGTEIKVCFKTKEGLRAALAFLLRELDLPPLTINGSDNRKA